MKKFPQQKTQRSQKQKSRRSQTRKQTRSRRPGLYFKQGRGERSQSQAFNAPEIWHAPTEADHFTFVEYSAGENYIHPVTRNEVLERIRELPAEFQADLDVIQFSAMTRKRALFPCYGMQWGNTVYLYPIEANLEEVYTRAPMPQQRIETEMYGGQWEQHGSEWILSWTEETIRDFYLNNILIHEIGHINDHRNTRQEDRERYANWFAIEYGFRASRGRI
ncbi:hypothetical protein Pla110_17300 [Polystyrenella longa]|uniref:Uncharacterized protein n=1 Tax=Polystyrenella longa TaxID=2528007 RepID=A0A518CLA1_9PLAN|nr:hypothetical protein [Polystyrenella longa]QDU80008.1 hypothetical protein Pla110_17300 [Polystyrenella longa]